MNILQAMGDKKLFRPWFKDPSTWASWRAFLACLFNLPMDDEQRAIGGPNTEVRFTHARPERKRTLPL
jgi:hypothetical protein